MKVSPQKAADQAGVSRRTIMVAIENHDLEATRNNRNHWQIDPADLSKWIEDRDSRINNRHDTYSESISSTISGEVVALRVANARLEAQLEAAAVRITNLERQLEGRDTDYQTVVSLLAEAQKPKGFSNWLINKFGRK